MEQRIRNKEQELAPQDRYFDLAGRGPDGGGLRMHVRDWGGAGMPIVLVHGLASSCRIWDLVAPALAKTASVVAVDQRGHGLSDRPDSSYSFEETCGDLAALMAALTLARPLLAGHSWGASVALQYAAENPEAVRGLVLVDGGVVEISSRLGWEQAQTVMRPPDIDGLALERFLQFARSWPHVRDAWSPRLREMIVSNFLVRDGRIYRRLTIENHMKVVRAIYDQKPTRLYPKVTCPVLIVPALREPANEQEKAWQGSREQGIEAALRLLPNARLRPVEDSVHDIPVHRPEELAAIIMEFAREVA